MESMMGTPWGFEHGSIGMGVLSVRRSLLFHSSCLWLQPVAVAASAPKWALQSHSQNPQRFFAYGEDGVQKDWEAALTKWALFHNHGTSVEYALLF